MRRHGSPQELERVRRTAVVLHAQGVSTQVIARSLDRSQRSVQKWITAVREHGPESIAAKPHAGAPSKLSDEERADLREQLLQGAQAHGFSTDLWTAPRVQHVIRKRYRVEYHVHYVPELLKALNFSPQKPERQAREQNKQDVANWLQRDLPRIKKKRAG